MSFENKTQEIIFMSYAYISARLAHVRTIDSVLADQLLTMINAIDYGEHPIIEEIARTLFTDYRKEPLLHMCLAVAYVQAQQHEAALGAITAAIEYEDDPVRCSFLLSYRSNLLHQCNFDANVILADLERAMKLNIYNSCQHQLVYRIVRISIAHGMIDRALECCDAYIKVSDECLDALLTCGQFLAELGKRVHAREYFALATRLYPQSGLAKRAYMKIISEIALSEFEQSMFAIPSVCHEKVFFVAAAAKVGYETPN